MNAPFAFSLGTAYTEQYWVTIAAMKMHMTCARQCQGIKMANLSSRLPNPSIHMSWNMTRERISTPAHYLSLNCKMLQGECKACDPSETAQSRAADDPVACACPQHNGSGQSAIQRRLHLRCDTSWLKLDKWLSQSRVKSTNR